MKMKEVKTVVEATTETITKEGGETMTKEKLDRILRNLGFARVKEVFIPPYGEHFKIVYSINDYEVEVEPNQTKKHFSNEGAEVVLEIRFKVQESDIAYHIDVYRVIRYALYIVHIFVGFEEEYFAVYVWDKQNLEEIAKIELHGGYIFVGSQKDLMMLLPKLIKELNPFAIKVY